MSLFDIFKTTFYICVYLYPKLNLFYFAVSIGFLYLSEALICKVSDLTI